MYVLFAPYLTSLVPVNEHRPFSLAQNVQEVVVAVGGVTVLFTVTCTLLEVVVLFAASLALAVRVWVVFG